MFFTEYTFCTKSFSTENSFERKVFIGENTKSHFSGSYIKNELVLKQGLWNRNRLYSFHERDRIGNHHVAAQLANERIEEHARDVGTQNAKGNGYGGAENGQEGKEGYP